MIYARAMTNEKTVYYGCVFRRDDEYYCFLPQWETRIDRSKRLLSLHAVDNQPRIGDRVDLPCRFQTSFSDHRLFELIPVGKFGLDEYYDLKGRCTLIEFDSNEKLLDNLQLVDSFRRQYLDYRIRVPEGTPRSLEDLERLGFATDLDRALEKEKNKKPNRILSAQEIEAIEDQHDLATGARKPRWCVII